MKNNKTLILLTAYNGFSSIREQLDTIILQANTIVDVVISIDFSDDDTFSVCSDYARKNINVRLLSYGERFGGAGKNFYRLLKDVELSGYDYIAFSDQDDIWPRNKLAKAIEKLQQYDCYSANVTAFWADGRKELIDKAQSQCEWDFLFEAAGPGCTYVFKRDVAMEFKAWLLERYQQVGEDIALHDWLLYAFARSQGYSWFIDPEPMMSYRQHANNQVGTNNSFGAAKKRLHMIKSKWYRNQCTNIAEHLALHHLPVVKYGLNKGYVGNLYLLFHIHQLRRRLRDRVALSIALLFNLF
ncbi:glycosyltransferase [Aeromonas salmonicida]|uniref:glycosyltransferase n=1 Tax=Aeromonas salmonicida TaxID=645 RepID=UPI000F76A439|nr:glycosyltransferase [Aeromonas salmonicida]RSM31364.1 glycosyl transferase [Aeromonas salmonicida]